MPDEISEFRTQLLETLDSHALPADLAAQIEGHLTVVTYEKGRVIFLRESPAELLFLLLKGVVKLYFPYGDGKRVLVDLARPGDFLGFVNDGDSNARRQLFEAHALTKCTVGLFPWDHLARLLNQLERETMTHVLEQLHSHWSRTLEWYMSFIGSSFRVRLEMVLNSLSSRFGFADMRGTLLVPELSHEDLAEMIGSSRPMVSKLLGDMMREGLLVAAEKHHLILRAKVGKAPASSKDSHRSDSQNGASKQAARVRTIAGHAGHERPHGLFS